MVMTTVEFDGRTFSLSHSDDDDHIFRTIRSTRRFYESDLLERLAQLVRPGDLVVDAGANIGNHTVFFAGVCGCRVMAFEPVPAAFSLLEKNIADNGLTHRVTAYAMALGEGEGRASINLSEATHNLGGASLRVGGGEVIVRRLDDVLDGQSRPALIKIDTEGFELAVLRGAERILKASRPLLCVEAKDLGDYGALFDHLVERHYLLGETHNFSPTHVFFPVGIREATPVRRALSRFVGAFYIRAEAEQQRTRERLLQLERRVKALVDAQAAPATPEPLEARAAGGAAKAGVGPPGKTNGRRGSPGRTVERNGGGAKKAGKRPVPPGTSSA